MAITVRAASALKAAKPSRYNRLIDVSRALERRIQAVIGDYGFKHCQ